MKSLIPLFVLRILIGGFFFVVGFDKIMHPYQNFLYVVQAYQLFPEFLEEIVARIFPWMEFFLGLFLLLGLWLKWTLRSFLLIISAFLLMIAQALIRKLPIDNCGCFGGLFSSKIQHTFALDACLWVMVSLMLKHIVDTEKWSLDRYFLKTEK